MVIVIGEIFRMGKRMSGKSEVMGIGIVFVIYYMVIS